MKFEWFEVFADNHFYHEPPSVYLIVPADKDDLNVLFIEPGWNYKATMESSSYYELVQWLSNDSCYPVTGRMPSDDPNDEILDSSEDGVDRTWFEVWFRMANCKEYPELLIVRPHNSEQEMIQVIKLPLYEKIYEKIDSGRPFRVIESSLNSRIVYSGSSYQEVVLFLEKKPI